jgi:hypothetical protein
MKSQLLVRLTVVAALAGGTAVAVAFDGSPPESVTGAPAIGAISAEGTCADCHSDFALNVGGSVTLIGAPTYYQPGTVYTFGVRVTSGQTAGSPGRVWGFELTAVRMSDGHGAGAFANVAGQGTQIVSGAGEFSTRSYMQVNTNNQVGAASPVTWQVQWTAPNPGVGPVSFFASGVAANGAAGNNGDWVYTGSLLAKDVTPIETKSWGMIKRSYR